MPDDFLIASLAPTPQIWSYATSPADALRQVVAANQHEHKHSQPGRAVRNYSIMTEAAYDAACRTHYLSAPLTEITAERFHEMLGILPPVRWEHRDGVERFMVSEAISGPFHSQFACCNGLYFEATVDATDPTTWITAAKIARHIAGDGFAVKEDRKASGKGRGV